MTLPRDSATELARRIAARELSASEALDECLQRITAENPKLNAVVTLDEARARERARAADAALARGESWGPLHGVPFTLKDGHETEGVLTTVGVPELADYVPKRDGVVASRLKAAGGILVGKTNVPPMLMSAQTDNPVFGRSNNPWNLERTTGGSSGGAAAAVAAGLVPFDVGSDMSGSIRIPAHFCGVYGIKPTANRVAATGHIPPPPGVPRPERLLCASGPIARSTADLGLVLRLISGPDGMDHDVPPVPWQEAPPREPKSLRLAFLPVFPGVPTSKAVRAVFDALITTLEREGVMLEEREPGFTLAALNEAWREYFRIGSAVLTELMGRALPVSAPAGPAPTFGDLARVLERRDQLLSELAGLFRSFDAFLSPASITTAFPHSPPRTPIPVDGESVDSRFIDHYLYPWNFTGAPAVVVPAGIAHDGLPVGVQLVGPRWGDEALLAVAETVCTLAGGFRPPPGG
jgi:amidase